MNAEPQTADQPIQSDQTGPHTDLARTVLRHDAHPWLKPVPSHTRHAADQAVAWLDSLGRPPLILDSFCGTGMSTALIAQHNPGCVVIGVDKSADRLSRHVQASTTQYRLFRAECEPFWRCLVDACVTLRAHTLLYPNPWPKARHLKRRIHGHPGFPLLKALGGDVEVRTNWSIYVQEFALAWEVLGGTGAVDSFVPSAPVTLFERKYHQRGQALWRFVGNIAASSEPNTVLP